MTITAALIVFAVTWFMVFFLVLPFRFESRRRPGGGAGTPASAPATEVVRKKALITTAIAVVVWALIVAVITSGVVSIHETDVFGIMDKG